MFEEDLSLFYDVANGFAEPAVHTAAGGAQTPVHVIYSTATAPAGGVLDDLVNVTQPGIRLPASAVPGGIKRGDAISFRSQSWRVKEAPTPTADGAELLVPLAKA